MVEGRRGVAGVHGDKQLCVVSELVIGNAESLDEFTDWCDVRREEQRSEYGPLRGTLYRHGDVLDECRPSLTYCCRPVRYERSQLTSAPSTPNSLSRRLIRTLWSMLSMCCP